MHNEFALRLYVTGQTTRSQQAIRNVVRACREAGDFEQRLSIIDVLERPDYALQARILATPTLVVEQPTSDRRFIGDLSQAANLQNWLDGPDAECEYSP